jgi:uncharacterized membrane protein (Fun14 family)
MKAHSKVLALSVLAGVTFGAAQNAPGNGVSDAAQMQRPVQGRAFPSTFGVATTVAPRYGAGFVGATYANLRGGVSGAGADAVAGYSVGNAIDAISLTFGVAFIGLDLLGDAGAFSVKASRLIQVVGSSATFAGITFPNLLAWGANSNRRVMTGVYISHLVGIPSGEAEIPVQLTLGYGTETTHKCDGSGILGDGLFARIGLGVAPKISMGVSATCAQVNMGATPTTPGTRMGTTIGVFDMTNATELRQVSLSVGFAL